MIGLWNVNWLNQNSQRSYPLAEHGDKLCFLSQDIRLPDDFLLALRLSINAGHNIRVENFFVKSITVAGTGCTVLIGYNDGSSATEPSEFPDVASIYATSGEEIATCRMTGLGDFADTAGYAAINPSAVKNLAGTYTFLPESTPIEPDCVIPMLRSVSSIAIQNKSTVSDKIYGDIVLEAGSNMEITTKRNGNTTIITLSAKNTDNFEETCVCDLHETGNCITSINGVRPDATGNINIAGSGCLVAATTTNGVQLSDSCATPDCGCDELEALAQALRTIENNNTTQSALLENLYGAIMQTQLVVTSSSLSNGC
ncbi:MAG: hypothetical protein Q4D38_00225 [Planctomycetia bacterium]|nr:hypothetical protein [Planctomycetia bacterium]